MKYTSTYIKDLKKVQEAIPDLNILRNSRILITGATGLVCSAIVDFLFTLNDTIDAKIKIYVTARTEENVKNRFGDKIFRPDIIYIKYDALEDIDWNFNLDYIIHGASPANPLLYVNQPVETMMANIHGLNAILNFAKTHTVKRVLFVSSSEIYGKKDGNDSYTEDEYGYVDILNPRACYPSAKRACETLCAAYYNEYRVESVIVRLGHIFGPTATRTDTRASSQFFYDVIDGHDIIMKSAGLQMRSYCYVVDCVSAILAVLINGKVATAYNISNSLSIVSIRELAEAIALASNKKVIYENPSDIENKGYNLMLNSSLNSARIEALGWRGHFDLLTGISHTIRILEGE